ncbi:hypothetical protein OF83DRAFT_1124100, partial [Amylostereum chailletii]
AFLDPLGVCDDRLLSVICIDEAHGLTEPIDGVSWTLFDELLRSLHEIRNIPFFTVFLSTFAEFRALPPKHPLDPRSMFNLFDPITKTGFYEFASNVDVYDRTWTLSRVASTYQISHLGRSLFPSRYDASAGGEKTRRDMIGFSRAKLLCGEPEIHKLDTNMKLACLAWEDRKAERTQPHDCGSIRTAARRSRLVRYGRPRLECCLRASLACRLIMSGPW